jgi:hypothetical protein
VIAATCRGRVWVGEAEQARHAAELPLGFALLVIDGEGAGRLRVEQVAKREDGPGIGGAFSELVDDAQYERAVGEERKRRPAAEHDAPPGKDQWIARTRPPCVGEGAAKRRRRSPSGRLGAQLAQTVVDELARVAPGSDHDSRPDQLICCAPSAAAGERAHADLEHAPSNGKTRQDDPEPPGARLGRQEHANRGQRRQARDATARQPPAGARASNRSLRRSRHSIRPQVVIA